MVLAYKPPAPKPAVVKTVVKPAAPKPPAGYLPVRATVEAGGGTVGYDPQKGVSIGGNYLNKGDYTIINGTAYAKPGTIVSGIRSSVATPEAPAFNAPAYNVMSLAKAREQARAQLQPAYQEARSNAGVVNQQQLHQLQQAMNAKGQLDSGTAIQGEINNSAALQSTLGNIDTNYNTQAEQVAEALRQQSVQEQQDAFNRALQQFQTQYQGHRDDVGDQQWQKGFDATQSQNAVANRLAQNQEQRLANESTLGMEATRAGMSGYYKDPVTGKVLPTLEKIKQDAAIADARADNARMAASGGRSRSGGGSKASSVVGPIPNGIGTHTQNSRSNNTTAINGTIKEMNGYQEGVDAGATWEELMNDFNKYKDQWASLGYDLNKILDVINKAPRAAQKYHFGGW